MAYQITIQQVARRTPTPAIAQLRRWARQVLQQVITAAELTLRIVNNTEMAYLNATYRHKVGPTNVLSFPLQAPAECQDQLPLLGDVVLCADVIHQEALAQGKSPDAHWAHMITHGILHLVGYDHVHETDALIMEKKESAILLTLGYANPYEPAPGDNHA